LIVFSLFNSSINDDSASKNTFTILEYVRFIEKKLLPV
jgi:hypothetical protein